MSNRSIGSTKSNRRKAQMGNEMAECFGSMLEERQQREFDKWADMADRAGEIAEQMQIDLMRAVEMGDQARSMPTPGSHKPRLELWEVFSDWLSTDDTVKLMLAVLTAAVNSTDPAARIQAQAALARFAQQYSDMHTDDAMAAERGEA